MNGLPASFRCAGVGERGRQAKLLMGQVAAEGEGGLTEIGVVGYR